MSLEENRALAHRFYELHDVGDVNLLDEAVSKDCLIRIHGGDDLEGVGHLKDHITEARMAFPDIEHIIDHTVAEGDTVAVRLRFRGTLKNEYGGIAPTGERVGCTAMVFLRISGGKVVEGWCDYDKLGFMQQLGMELRPREQAT